MSQTTMSRYKAPADIHMETWSVKTQAYRGDATFVAPLRPRTTEAVALFIGGTGAYDRHGHADGFDIGSHQLLDGLARKGIASLRYDKFSSHYPDWRSAEEAQDFQVLVRDAALWAERLFNRPAYGALPKIFIGHSFGAMVAFAVDAKRPGADLIVALASPGRTLRDITQDQHDDLLRSGGFSEEVRQALNAQRRAFMAAVQVTEPWTAETVSEDLLPFRHQHAFFRSALDLDPRQLIGAGQAPVLIVQGDHDAQVSDLDRELLEVMTAHYGRHAGTHVAPGLNHLFKRATGKGPQSMTSYRDRRRRVPVSFIKTLAERIKMALRQ